MYTICRVGVLLATIATLYNNFLLKRGVGLFSGDYGTALGQL